MTLRPHKRSSRSLQTQNFSISPCSFAIEIMACVVSLFIVSDAQVLALHGLRLGTIHPSARMRFARSARLLSASYTGKDCIGLDQIESDPTSSTRGCLIS